MSDGSACCAPAARAAAGAPRSTVAAGHRSIRGQVLIPGGTFSMGDHFDEGYAADGETPVHDVRLDAFHIDATAVTNASFAAFVKATGYVTEAEEFGVSAVFHLAFKGDRRDVVSVADGAPWWLAVRGHPGATRRVPDRASTTGRTIRWSTSPGMTHRPTAPGPVSDFPPRRSGSTPPVEAWPVGGSYGATIFNPATDG